MGVNGNTSHEPGAAGHATGESPTHRPLSSIKPNEGLSASHSGKELLCATGMEKPRGPFERRYGFSREAGVSRPVSRVLCGPPACGKRTWRPFFLDAHCCASHATYPDGWTGNSPGGCPPRHPYSVLLPVGFAIPLPLPPTWWALTPPFHPYPAGTLLPLWRCRSRKQDTDGAVCFLLHFPWGRPRRPLTGTVSPWSPDFPHPRPFGPCGCGRPAD